MVKTTLVEPLILDGATILRALDRQGFPVECMFWLDLPERDHWRLIIASPVVAAKGGREAYLQVGNILRGLELELAGVTLSDIAVLDPDSQQFKSFRSAAAASGRLAAEQSWERYGGAVVYRWTSDFITGKLSCKVTAEELNGAWSDYRRLKGVTGPALLIGLDDGQLVTLRFHPQHYELKGIEQIARTFQLALHQKLPNCQVDWLT